MKKIQYVDSEEEVVNGEEYYVVNSDGEVVSYYSNNNIMNEFYKKASSNSSNSNSSQNTFFISNKTFQVTNSNDISRQSKVYSNMQSKKKLVGDLIYNDNSSKDKIHLAHHM